MPFPRRTRARFAVVVVAAAVSLITASPALAAPVAPAAPDTAAAPSWHSASVTMFPNNDLTVPDPRQITGRRVNLPLPDCATRPTDCNSVRLLDQLDGFDLDPQVSLTFDRAVDPAQVAASVRIVKLGWPTSVTGVDRVVYDAATHTVRAHPQQQLEPDTTYLMLLWGTVRFSVFTTESATADLLSIRRQLDSGSAYRAAGISSGQRGLQVDADVPAAGTTLQYVEDLGGGKSATVPVPNTSSTGAGHYVFGHFAAPSWLDADSVIPQRPTRLGPAVTGRETLPFVLIEPAGTPPPGGWPVAIFGHGFTRDDRDLFLAADVNAAQGIATIATDVVGHGYGPGSSWLVSGVSSPVPAYARGVDQNGDGTIGNTEGVSAPPQPSPVADVSSRDGLRQTVSDLMALVRAVGHGGVAGLRPTDVDYYGQSFGGIYGTMLGGVDPKVPQLVLNVAGGPVSEIARLSPSFRLLATQDLGGRQPSLLNGGPSGFTESMPLRGQPPVTNPAPGALAIQDALARETWLDRSGSPETYSPLLRLRPPAGSTAKQVIFQNAFGDQTVPNPTNYTVLAAGQLFDRESLYRNDKNTAVDPSTGLTFAQENPHGFILSPFNPASLQGQIQIVTFFRSGGTLTINPGPALWEVPIADPAELLPLNFTPVYPPLPGG